MSRPPLLSCSSKGEGIWGHAVVKQIRSYGASSGCPRPPSPWTRIISRYPARSRLRRANAKVTGSMSIDTTRPVWPTISLCARRVHFFWGRPGCSRGLALSVPVAKEPHLVTPPVFFDHFDCALPALKLRGVQCSTRRCNTRLPLTRRLSQSE
jgi:hypothetical protein